MIEMALAFLAVVIIFATACALIAIATMFILVAIFVGDWFWRQL